jgi:rubrerythrin
MAIKFPPERSCFRKIRFPDRAMARRVAKDKERQFGKKFSIYACPICDGYHLRTRKSEPCPADAPMPKFY